MRRIENIIAAFASLDASELRVTANDGILLRLECSTDLQASILARDLGATSSSADSSMHARDVQVPYVSSAVRVEVVGPLVLGEILGAKGAGGADIQQVAPLQWQQSLLDSVDAGDSMAVRDRAIEVMTARIKQLLRTRTSLESRIAIQDGQIADLTQDRDRARAAIPTCTHCDQRPAACFGRYEGGDPDDGPEPACDQCCAHGNEDGWCLPIADLLGWATTLLLNVDGLALERDALLAVVQAMLASAHPHPVEHPTMTAAWARARRVVACTRSDRRALTTTELDELIVHWEAIVRGAAPRAEIAPDAGLAQARRETQQMLDRIGAFDIGRAGARQLLAVIRRLCEAMITEGTADQ